MSINTSTINVALFPALSVATYFAYFAPLAFSVYVFVLVISPETRFDL